MSSPRGRSGPEKAPLPVGEQFSMPVSHAMSQARRRAHGRASLLAAEASARTAGLGLWADPYMRSSPRPIAHPRRESRHTVTWKAALPASPIGGRA